MQQRQSEAAITDLQTKNANQHALNNSNAAPMGATKNNFFVFQNKMNSRPSLQNIN